MPNCSTDDARVLESNPRAMERRAFLGALASGGAVVLAGCTAQRETISTVSTTTRIPSGEFYHRPLRIDERGKQFNLRYEVTADAPFDVMLFGGQSDPGEFETYRQLVRRTEGGGHHAGGMGCGEPLGGGNRRHGDGRHRQDGGAHRHGGDGAAGGDQPHGRGSGYRPRCPEPSEWHSVMGARGNGEVNRPLSPGTHHFVVDNTRFGEATPTGTLRPTIDLRVRDFDMFSG
jgi:hypothetical protein